MLSNLNTLSLLRAPVAFDWQYDMRDLLSLGVIAMLAVMLVVQVRAIGNDRGQRALMRSSVRANLSLLLFNDMLLSLVSATSLLLLAERYGGQGLLSGVRDPRLSALLAFLLLDLTHYAWHRANHRWDFLWSFHKVHHSDLAMNATTAFRLHFMEALLTVLVKAVFVVATGVHATVVICIEAFMALFVIFHHTNVAVPGERWLGQLFVVPALHRVHHSVRRDEHDNNYGAVLSIWDRIFGTLAERVPAKLGIKGVASLNFFELLKLGLMPVAAAPATPDVTAMIAEAAYFKAEKRGFAPGMEMLDWLDAEREIRDRFEPLSRTVQCRMAPVKTRVCQIRRVWSMASS